VADYTPVYIPGRVITLTALTAVTGGDLLVVAGNGQAAKASAVSQVIIGVAADDTPANGRVTVYGRGTVHESIADGSITAGKLLISTATANRQVAVKSETPLATQDVTASPTNITINAAINAVVAAVNAENDRDVIGVALTGNPDGLKVRWMEF
jgi:hypothetical protein